MVWYGMVWCGMVWYSMVRCRTLPVRSRLRDGRDGRDGRQCGLLVLGSISAELSMVAGLSRRCRRRVGEMGWDEKKGKEKKRETIERQGRRGREIYIPADRKPALRQKRGFRVKEAKGDAP